MDKKKKKCVWAKCRKCNHWVSLSPESALKQVEKVMHEAGARVMTAAKEKLGDAMPPDNLPTTDLKAESAATD